MYVCQLTMTFEKIVKVTESFYPWAFYEEGFKPDGTKGEKIFLGQGF